MDHCFLSRVSIHLKEEEKNKKIQSIHPSIQRRDSFLIFFVFLSFAAIHPSPAPNPPSPFLWARFFSLQKIRGSLELI